MRTMVVTIFAVGAVGSMGCLPASVGEWDAEVGVTSVDGTPPAAIADTYRVSAALVSSPFAGQGDCGIRVEVVGLGIFELNGGVGCTDDGFDALLQESAILETSVSELRVLRLNAVQDGDLTMQLDGGDPAWTKSYAGPAQH